MDATPIFKTKNRERFVSATAVFDGHDVPINIIRRVLVDSGAEVIHLGHSRTVAEVVEAAIQEDVHGIAVSAHQGGHVEYFTYLRDLLAKRGVQHMKVFGGGGGVIVQSEIDELAKINVKIFSPQEGLQLGYQGMINKMLQESDFEQPQSMLDSNSIADNFEKNPVVTLSEILTAVENGMFDLSVLPEQPDSTCHVVGLTGTGGSGKSTLVDEFTRRMHADFPDWRVGVLFVDPTKRSGGALLGDRLRLNVLTHVAGEHLFVRSFATRGSEGGALSACIAKAIQVMKRLGFNAVFVETAGIGQSNADVVSLVDTSLYVMTSEFGSQTQLEKTQMLETDNTIVIVNKFEKRGAMDALTMVRKTYQRNHKLFDTPLSEIPVYPAIAADFNDSGVSFVYTKLLERMGLKSRLYDVGPDFKMAPQRVAIVPNERCGYLGEIARAVRNHHALAREQSRLVGRWESCKRALDEVTKDSSIPESAAKTVMDVLEKEVETLNEKIDPRIHSLLNRWNSLREAYGKDVFEYTVRGRKLEQPFFTRTLSGTRVPRVAVPETTSGEDLVRFLMKENVPGEYPFTAGVFPLKRTQEDPTRMFAGEGCPERSNKRFHYLARNQKSVRLSTAVDSLTFYGANATDEPDLFSRIGNSGVSISTVDDLRKLYSGFDLNAPTTSVSMTVNGPMPIVLAMFFNITIDQAAEELLRREGKWQAAEKVINEKLGPNRPKYVPFEEDSLPEGHSGHGLGLLGCHASDLVEWGLLTEEQFKTLREHSLRKVRGTCQTDVLKEEQANNAGVLSTPFALKLVGDVEQFLVDNHSDNYYVMSVCGYHLTEAGANAVTQLAFTLANCFTYIEYFASRGMAVDDFMRHMSFMFAIGSDIEYNVLNRVARRIYAIALKEVYGANHRSQLLKNHIQTSGRSLQAEEIRFNDIRTTLQGLSVILDGCQSLHTNAYDEAITTPGERSVRQALAIQRIIYEEYGLTKNDNPTQGSYLIEQLTDAVEEAVLDIFMEINDRGGVLPAMEFFFQRQRILEESMEWERQIHCGEMKIVGVNTFRPPAHLIDDNADVELRRSSEKEREYHYDNLMNFHHRHACKCPDALARLKKVVLEQGNVFVELLETVKVCSLGQITTTLKEVGGECRRYT